MVSKRTEKKKLKRKRKRKTILSVLLILFLSAIAFSVYEYWAGKNAAQEDMEKYRDEEKSEQYENEFTGDDEAPEDERTNVLILGEDYDRNGTSRTDTIMVGQYDKEHNRAKLVSIMRDTYVDIPGYGKNKINAAFAYGGPELLRKTIKQNFGIDLHYYAIVNFKGFESIVDTIAPDGVQIDVEKRMYYNAKDVYIDLYPGVQNLDGSQLLDYARYRNDYESDFGRVRRQQQVMSALKDEMLSFTSLIKLPRTIGTLQPYIDTNMKGDTIVSIATDFLKDTPDQIETMRIPMEGTYSNQTYSHAGAVLEINKVKNSNELQEFFENQPKEEDQTNESNNSDSSDQS
ncbi:LCP family protein [Aquisalibacillus elongatus]|uniref:Regulatory protein MsrR n=1 Tax=Aquisalibacillus elongatus TaxID=485577 RepID=A0A3N5C6Q0_9BACI|nr:LCP family protein [Aquisalibacillus elongatus]RPF52101.1 LytR family transcriptional attenuator [Aquisalibacillus elongatus]